MVSAARSTRERATQADHRRLLVPISGSDDHSKRALEIACILAAKHSVITAVFVIEVSPLLPLDAQMADDESAARLALLRAEAIGDRFGVRFKRRVIRARDPGPAIVELAKREATEMIVVAAPRRRRAYGRHTFGHVVRHVLAKAPCRVLLVAPPVG